MDNRQRKLKRLKLLQDMGQSKEHFKMYKVRKSWLFAGITVLFFGTGIFFGHPMAYADTTAEVPTTEVASSAASSASSGSKAAASSATSSAASESSTVSASSSSASSSTSSVVSSSATSSASKTAKSLSSATSTSSAAASSETDATSSTASSEATSSSSQSSATSKTTTLVNPTSAEISQAKSLAAKVYAETGDAQLITAQAEETKEVNTGDLNGTNPAGSDAATSTINTPSDVQDSFEITGTATGGTNGSATLTTGVGQNGSYVFDNQVDTSKTFTLQGSYSSDNFKYSGGGLGIILQPVDPQDAGKNANTTADVGIDGLASTTFIGRDFFQDSNKGDTKWSSLTIRQTGADGKIITTPLANITAGTGQTEAVTKGEYYILTWKPTGTDASGNEVGTLNYTIYKDAAHTVQVQTTGNVVTTLRKAVSLAAFGATGGGASTIPATITSFTGTRVTMPVTVNYVDQDGNVLADPSTITVNVGSTFGVAAHTDTENNTDTNSIYATLPVDGYVFGVATGPVTVINTNISTGSNNITVTYLKLAGTQTVSYDNVPDNSTGLDFTNKSQTATEASTKEETKDAVYGYAEVPINQIPGYTSMVSVNGAAAVAMKSLPAEDAGAEDETDVVTYVANQASVVIHYQDYFNNTIAPDGSLNGDYTATVDGTANAPTVADYTFNAKDAKNNPATAISFSTIDADGNVVATDATGATVTEITLYYKTNITLTVTGTKVYDGLGGSTETNDRANITFTNTDTGKPIVLNLDNINTNSTFYYDADVGTYKDGAAIAPALLGQTNPAYEITNSGWIKGVYVVTPAPVTATIPADSTATKVYDGQPISYVPTVDFARTDTEDTSAIVPNTGTNDKDQITWDAADFEYLQNGVVVANPKDVGTYSIQYSAAGKAKLAAATNFAITPVYDGTYTIRQLASPMVK